MCQCTPKCEKCCKAATIYRSTIHILHNSPQHSCTVSTNSGLWSNNNSIVCSDNQGFGVPTGFGDPTGETNAQEVKKGGEETSTECTKKVKEPISNTQPPPPPLMSLTIRRESKKARAKEKKRTKKQNDLRLLLEKKNTQKHSYHEVNIFIVLKICATVALVVVVNVLN
jgi:hypothetical protein